MLRLPCDGLWCTNDLIRSSSVFTKLASSDLCHLEKLKTSYGLQLQSTQPITVIFLNLNGLNEASTATSRFFSRLGARSIPNICGKKIPSVFPNFEVEPIDRLQRFKLWVLLRILRGCEAAPTILKTIFRA